MNVRFRAPSLGLLRLFFCLALLSSGTNPLARADTVYVHLEFSSGTPQSYALTKPGSFFSGVEVLSALVYSLGGGYQSFSPPYAASPLFPGNRIQWWTWRFGLGLVGLSLADQTDEDWISNYWALYIRASSNDTFSLSPVGLAETAPSDGSWLALKFSSFSDESLPLVASQPQGVSFSAPTDSSPPKVLSSRRISAELIEITFATVPGGTYRLESTGTLSISDWSILIPDFVATSAETTFTVPLDPEESQRFYRLARSL
jgi:hypothetical protein